MPRAAAPRRPAETTAPPPNAVAVFDPVAAGRNLSTLVQGRREQFATLLGVLLEDERGKAVVDRFVTVALHAATSSPDILRATPESIVESIRDAAVLGLEPVGVTGDGSIVVYNEKVKVERPGRTPGSTIIVEEVRPTAHFSPMYRGLLKLARRSNEIAHIDAHVVYSGDRIELDLGSAPVVHHYPELDGSKRGGYLGAYAVATMRDGSRYVDWMTLAEIELVRRKSRASGAMAWTDFFPEMARKTVLRRMMKRLPLETSAEHALRIENEAESEAVPTPAESVQVTEARDRLRSRFAKPVTEAPAETGGTAAPTAPPETTNTRGEGESAVSVDPTGSVPPDEVEGTATELPTAGKGPCGATSDPERPPVETCRLAKGHPGPHVSKEDSRWPNR